MFCCHNSVHMQIIDIPTQILPVQIRHGENWDLKDKCLGAMMAMLSKHFGTRIRNCCSQIMGFWYLFSIVIIERKVVFLGSHLLNMMGVYSRGNSSSFYSGRKASWYPGSLLIAFSVQLLAFIYPLSLNYNFRHNSGRLANLILSWLRSHHHYLK